MSIWATLLWIVAALAVGAAAGGWLGRGGGGRDSPASEIDRLRERERQRARVLADVAHELRTPLTLIAGNIEEVQSGRGDHPAYRLEVARRNARRLHRLVDELLELSRLDAGGLKLNPVTGDLVSFVQGNVAAFEPLADLKDVELTLRAPPGPVTVSFEPDKLEKVLFNLLSNALKFGSGSPVEVRISVEDGWARLEVEDRGVGIPAESLPHVFDRFYRARESEARRYEGSGIGLALTRELVELHGGTVTAASEGTRGALFTVRLPLATDGPANGKPAEPARGRPSWMPPGGPAELATLEAPEGLVAGSGGEAPLVLVLEDNREMRSYIRGCLADAFRVAEAGDGETGLELARELIPDLVLTDLVMPGLHGRELVLRLREDPRTSHVPIVVLTARASPESRVLGLELGADDYVTKPFSQRELHARVANLIALRRMLRERWGQATSIRPSEVEATPVDRRFLEQVVQTVEDHMDDPEFTVESLAAAVHMSASQLTRKLRAVIDQTPGRLLRSLRLQRAADLLAAERGNIASVAYRVGFSDQAHFSRCFKRHFGVTPSEHRRRGPEPSSGDAWSPVPTRPDPSPEPPTRP